MTVSVARLDAVRLTLTNHLSFIKEIAPEIGRGIRFSYTVNWF